MSTHTPTPRVVSLMCLAAALAALAGCAASKPERAAAAATAHDQAAISPSIDTSTDKGSVPAAGTVTGETMTIYRATPVEHDGFEMRLAYLHAQTSCTFAMEESYRAGTDGWKMTLRFNIRDEQDGRWSRLAGPMRITSMIDDAGNELAAKVNTKATYSGQNVMFLRPSKRSSPSWQSLEMAVSPETLPRQIRTLRGEVPMEVVSEAKVFTLSLAESREEELVPGVKANLRVLPNEADSSDRYRRVNLTLELVDKNVPLVRSVLYVGPDGRSRDVGGMNFEDGADGIRRATFNLSAEVEKGGSAPAVKIDLVLALTPVTVPFEFRNIPVGAMGK